MIQGFTWAIPAISMEEDSLWNGMTWCTYHEELLHPESPAGKFPADIVGFIY
jgi:hypothetical protein